MPYWGWNVDKWSKMDWNNNNNNPSIPTITTTIISKPTITISTIVPNILDYCSKLKNKKFKECNVNQCMNDSGLEKIGNDETNEEEDVKKDKEEINKEEK
ncbi:hypothetical protein BCR32DRAFT_275650 [Anaeromyces robustus]|uniref:Uncharacterized protein n=1 Tax=Anaeromyces robustus TaxID=1754192 RepID=A0A1Y1XK35_9FUNG|nr:hypothetical protein BCR32DRAFT_275650 [Anaeromyces robustus]|eukprot:ORX86108.1 hypothetical protein BCR32DRAFT_275650 [Anaeromyces robustus]